MFETGFYYLGRIRSILHLRKRLVTPYRYFPGRINRAAMNKLFCWFLLFVFWGQMLASCTPFAPAARLGQEELPLPDSFSIKDSIQDPKQRWWEAIGDEQLDRFVDEALTDNQTLLSYWARLEKAQAQARKEGADLKPSLAGAAGASYTRIETDNSSVENENYSIGLVAGYEVDLWGA